MLSFKEFILESNKQKDIDTVDGLPVFNTSFGNHSRKQSSEVEVDKDGNPILNTIFGKHSSKSSDEDEIHEDTKKELNDLHRRLLKHHKDYTPQDKVAIRMYTRNSYDLNSYLHRKATGNIKKKSNEHEIQDKAMHDAIHRHAMPEDTTVYSGVRQSPEHVLKAHGKKDGVKVTTTNYTSTSIDKNKADNFAESDKHSKYNVKGKIWQPKHMLKIHVPKGHPAAYAEKHSYFKGEREVVLPHGTKMHIHPHPEYDSENNTYVWSAHVLPHGKK